MKENLVKISGGLAIMFSVFLFLATAKQVVDKNTVSTKIVNNPVEADLSKQGSDLSENVLKGAFNVNTPGNVIRSHKENGQILYHYKAITSQKLKNEDIIPTLKLEIKSNDKSVWKETQWSWIDYNQGILYFHFKTIENGIETIPENYTGKFQLIFK